LLDFKISTIGGRANFDYYQKAAKSAVFVNFKSALPITQKINIISNEHRRIAARCTDPASKAHHLGEFGEKLSRNGYPASIIGRTFSQTHRQDSGQSHPRSRERRQSFYLKLPFFNDALYFKAKNIFRKYGLPVTIVPQSRSLRSRLRSRSGASATLCSIPGCLTAPGSTCFRSNVVYKLTCHICHLSYIGSTIRALHIRIAEHFKSERSAIYKHVRECIGCTSRSWGVRVLAQGVDPVDVRLKEALLIKRFDPKLNRREELLEVQQLTLPLDTWHRGTLQF